MKKILFCLLFLFVLLPPVMSSTTDFDRGLEAMNSGDYAIAFCLWEPLAQLGHPDAQYHLGWLYANGNGLNVNVKKAVTWWQKAAENGYLEAQFSIGLAYTTGEGLKADTHEAFKWFLKAALGGHEDAKDIVKRFVLESGKDYYQQFPEIKTIEWLKQPVMVKGQVVNIRSGPGTQFKIIYKAKKDQVFSKISHKNDWIEVIMPDGDSGWVYSTLVKTL